MDDITFFGETNFRDQKRRFGIKTNDRSKHMYIIGKTGMGKTTLLENMAIQDIMAGKGVGIVDPHGEFAEKMLDFVPQSRIKDVIYFNPADLDFPVAFNSMESVLPEQRHLIASGLLGVFKKIWPDVWSARMEYLLSNAILALLEVPGSTLLGINRMFADKEFRKSVVTRLEDPVIRAFWEKEYAQYQERFATEASAAIQNKVGQFVSNPLIRNIVGQEKSAVDIRKVMDEGKIFIMNLSKGRVGEENSRLLGAMLVTKLYLTAMTRVDVPEAERRDFYLYVDEFQNFATESFASILSEARKYRLNLILAHQYIAQMDEKVQDAVFGNVGTTISFRVGAQDAEILEKEFSPEFLIQDLVSLGFAQVYLKLMIDGIASKPFSAFTIAPMPKPQKSFHNEIVQFSRDNYASKAADVKEKIEKFHGLFAKPGVSVVAEPSGPRLSDNAGAGFSKGDRKLYEAHCIIDGEAIMVPFIPDGKRPVYCEKHLDMLKKGELPATPPKPIAPMAPRDSGGLRWQEVRPIPRSMPSQGHGDSTSVRASDEPYSERNRFSLPLPRPSIESRPAVRAPEGVKPISLQALRPKESEQEVKESISESKSNYSGREIKSQRKEVDLGGLRKVLEDSLKNTDQQKSPSIAEDGQRNKSKNSGVIKPGELIKFE
ncbi:MAG: type IV secretion system DNA-binding domain-containing protein [bacterium]|nr:type IV secretion system DNA-binding domain-containing protein [bacterium]